MNHLNVFKHSMQYFLATVLLVITSESAANSGLDLEKVANCVACHGADGIGKAWQYPNLQGKPIDYIIAQLEAFKAGTRKGSSMNVVAKPLSEDDIEMLAEFFNQVQ